MKLRVRLSVCARWTIAVLVAAITAGATVIFVSEEALPAASARIAYGRDRA